MALRALMLNKDIKEKRAALAAMNEKDGQMEQRESELEKAILEAITDDDRKTVGEMVEEFEEEKAEHAKAKEELLQVIAALEEELSKIEKEDVPAVRSQKREVEKMEMEIRSLPMNKRAFDSLPHNQRAAIVEQEDVKAFLHDLRSMKGQQRAVSGAELSIPIVFLELISENMFRYSKLLNRVRVRQVNGEARQTIAGVVPEAVWTEMCGAINELNFAFNQVTLDGFKVAGFVPVCNSILDDNDINLSSWIIEMLSEAIGLAMDKAILYGKGAGSKMPMGIVTRLAQTSRPSDYPAKAPEWVDLHTSNILKVDGTADAVEFWAQLAIAAGNAYTPYSRGKQFWAMNSRTYAKLRSKLITFNYAGGLVAQYPDVMPVIAGNVDVLEFIPDGDIIGGYGDLYLMITRSGMEIESSREVQFIQDNTVFKGKQRADGVPVIPGAFVAININNAAVTTAMNFAADTANDAQLQSLSLGSQTLSPAFNAATYTYTVTASGASAKVEATPAQTDAQIAIAYNGGNVRNGGTITFETGTLPLTVTVKQGNAVRVYTVNITKAAA